MKPRWLLLTFIVLFSGAQAQVIRISPAALEFGNTELGQAGGLEIHIENLNENFRPRVLAYPVNRDIFSLHWTGHRAEGVRAMEAIRFILQAALAYRNDFGEDPQSLGDLVELGYLDLFALPEFALEFWTFTLVGIPIAQIQAHSTENMPYGEGRVVLFDMDEGAFSGFGTPVSDFREPLTVQETLGAIWNAIRMYRQDWGRDPQSVDELLEQEYLQIPRHLMRRWSFGLVTVEQRLTAVEAVSSELMVDGPGKVIRFWTDSGNFTGYRMPYEEFYDWLYFDAGCERLTLRVDFRPIEAGRVSSELIIMIYGIGEEELGFRIRLSGNGVLSAPLEEAPAPRLFALHPAYPNPFNSRTFIRYELPHAEAVQVDLIDPSGRLVRRLFSGHAAAGGHQISIDGANLTSGIYFVRLRAESDDKMQKILLCK